jgi:hypothetical protein
VDPVDRFCRKLPAAASSISWLVKPQVRCIWCVSLKVSLVESDRGELPGRGELPRCVGGDRFSRADRVVDGGGATAGRGRVVGGGVVATGALTLRGDHSWWCERVPLAARRMGTVPDHGEVVRVEQVYQTVSAY